MNHYANTALLVRARAEHAAASLNDAEVRRLAARVEQLVQDALRSAPARTAHYSAGDYLKYDPDA